MLFHITQHDYIQGCHYSGVLESILLSWDAQEENKFMIIFCYNEIEEDKIVKKTILIPVLQLLI